MADYPWYEVVEGDAPLEQGDFIDNCPVLVPKADIKQGCTLSVDAFAYNVVVITQSCDLRERKIELVQVCPVVTLGSFADRSTYFCTPKGKEDLRRGVSTGYHLLNQCDLPGFVTPMLVVDFRSVHANPLTQVEYLAKQRGRRRRLLPPYREHLSQAFARFFMRVGLPCDIAPFI